MAGEWEQKCPARCRRGREAGMAGSIFPAYVWFIHSFPVFIVKSLAAAHMCSGVLGFTTHFHSLTMQTENRTALLTNYMYALIE